MKIIRVNVEKRIDGGTVVDAVRVIFDGVLPAQMRELIKRMDSVGEDYSVDAPLEIAVVFPKKKDISTVEIMDELKRENAELSGRIAGLIAPLVSGDGWSRERNYINGDVVKHMGDDYKAKRYSRGKTPDLHPEFWEKMVAEAVEPVVWTGLEHGVTIEVGTIVNYDNCKWRCLKEHKKSNVRKPTAFSDYWAQV